MSRTFARLSVVVLVLAMLVGMAGVAQASPPSWAGHDKDNNKHFSNMFGDISLEDYPWAFKHIEKMAAKGIIKGLGNGVFNGNAAIKHEEAVTMVVRYMDLEDEAQAAMKATLPFSDANKISAWARGYVKVAIDNNLLWAPDSTQLTKFDPTVSTSRLEAVTMLVKAAGLETEARAKMNQTLAFKDAATIPAAYIGYVAVGVEQGLVKGYDDNTFQPFKAVKRAEMATFLGRTDENIPHHGEDNEVEGEFVSATATTITVASKGHQGTYTLAANCPVYVNDVLSALTDLKAGDKVELELDSQDKVVFIDAERDGNVTPIPLTIAGTVKSVSIHAGTPSTITVTVASNAGDRTFTIATNCVVKIDGVASTLADIVVGDSVTLKLLSATSEQVTEITVTRNVQTSATGVVKGLSIGTTSRITILPDLQTANVTYDLTANCVVKVNGTVSSLAQAQIVVGDTVQLKLTAGKVTEINVIREQTSTVTGTVQAIGINTGSNSVITVVPNGQTTNTAYLMATSVTVKYVDHVVPLSEIKVGDKVTLTLTSSSQLPLVTMVVIANRETVTDGTITGINYDARTLTVIKNNVTTSYAVSSTAAVTLFGQSFTWNQVALNDVVTLTVVDTSVTKINVTVHNAVYTGVVTSTTVDSSGSHFVATINGVDRTVDVPATTVITHDGQAVNFSAITVGATVAVTGAFNGTKIVAAQIVIQ